MTSDERIALATLWYDLPPNDDWWQVVAAFEKLQSEGAITFDDDLMNFCVEVMNSRRFDAFDLLAQRVLENKLLGVTA